MIKQTIVNVVATASLNQDIDIEKLCQFKEILYDSNSYGGRVAYFKTNQMQGKVSIFLSGKLISIGTKSPSQAIKELFLTKQTLIEKGIIKEVEIQPKIQNMVITVDFGKQLDLEEFSEKTRAIYEPEQFPGAILRLEEPFKTSILLFASGKAVITALKNQDEIEPTIQALKNLIDSNQ
jgi:transcription initiation factor TFIID TATA-box-binding protein